MVPDTITVLRDAELRAQEIHQKTAAECERIRLAAKEEAQAQSERIAREAKTQTERLVSEARAKGDEMMQKAVADAQNEVAALEQTAAANKDKAVRFIISELV